MSAALRTALQSEQMTTSTMMLLELTRFTPRIDSITLANPGVWRIVSLKSDLRRLKGRMYP